MKVAIDISKMHELSRNRGIGIYAKNLFESLKKYTKLEIDLCEQKPDYKKYDLIHVPFLDFFSHTLSVNTQIPTVVTIHDLIPVIFPRHYPPGIRGRINWHLQKKDLKEVSRIITVSKVVKDDVEKILKINPEKISTVYSAPSDNFKKITNKTLLQRVKEKYKLPNKFVLYVGNINWNKNILNTTAAVLQANKNLVIIGSAFLDKTNLNHPEKKSFKSWIQNYGEDDRIKILGSLPEEEVVEIVNLANCLIFTSYYEGFGLPILEAQVCGTPVITSNVSSMPEIAGNGAFLANPESPESIISGLELIDDSKYREELIRKGYENSKRFSWGENCTRDKESL